MNLPESPRKQAPAARQVILALILLTATKVVLFLLLVRTGHASTFVGDNAEETILPVMERMLTEHRFNGLDSIGDSKIPPGYPFALAVLKFCTGTHYLVATVVLQMLMDLLVAYVIYRLALYLGLPTTGWVAAAAWLFYPPALLVSTWVTAEPCFTALLSLALAMFLFALPKPALRPMLLAGLVLGLATMFRGTSNVLAVFLLPLFLLPMVTRPVAKAACLLLGLACLTVPWIIRGEIVLHDRIPVAIGFGNVFLQGSDERYFSIDGKNQGYPPLWERAYRTGYVQRPKRASESDHNMFKLGLLTYRERLQTRPLTIVPFLIHKFLRIWYGTESAALRQQLILGVCSLAIVPLGILQLIGWYRGDDPRRRAFAVLALLTTIYFSILHVVTLPQYRYMHPIYPLLILPAACGALSAFRGVLGRGSIPSEAI